MNVAETLKMRLQKDGLSESQIEMVLVDSYGCEISIVQTKLEWMKQIQNLYQ